MTDCGWKLTGKFYLNLNFTIIAGHGGGQYVNRFPPPNMQALIKVNKGK